MNFDVMLLEIHFLVRWDVFVEGFIWFVWSIYSVYLVEMLYHLHRRPFR